MAGKSNAYVITLQGAQNLMFQKFIAAAAWALLVFVVYATVTPLQHRPTSHMSTGIEHFVAYAALGSLFCLAYPRRIALVCLLVVSAAALPEIMQYITPDRHARIHDAIEKAIGGCFGIVAVRAMHYFTQEKRN